MPRSSTTGIYTAPASSFNPAQTNTDISPTDWNALLGDLGTALNHASSASRALYPQTGQVQDGAFLWGGVASGAANTKTISLTPAITAYTAGQKFILVNNANANTGAVTLSVNGLAATPVRKGEGATALAAGDLPADALCMVVHDGTVFRLLAVQPSGIGLPLGRAADAAAARTLIGVVAAPGSAGVVTASGANVDFTGIPAAVRRVALTFVGLSTNGSGSPLIQLGTSSGFVTTGYLGATMFAPTGLSPSVANLSSGFVIGGNDAAQVRHGSLVLMRHTGNNWVGRLDYGFSNGAAMAFTSGSIALAGELDRLRVAAGGADTFDAGTINVHWEF